MLTSIGSVRLSDLTRPQMSGEPVNVHVVREVKLPEPDFEAMQKLISQQPNPAAEDTKPSGDGSR